MGLIIKFGGSLLFKDTSLDINKSKVMELIKIIHSSQKVQGIVCGGGKIARKYIHAGREMGFDEEKLDKLGIMVSRTNAQILIYSLGGTHSQPQLLILKRADEPERRTNYLLQVVLFPSNLRRRLQCNSAKNWNVI